MTNFLMLSGSPRGTISTSYNILEYLQLHLKRRGKSTNLVMTQKLLRNEDDFKNFISELDVSEYFVLACPLYVDSLPSPVMDIFMRISKLRNSGSINSKPKFIALVNNGFPEKHQNLLALQICEQFAIEANLSWFGGLPIGGGAMFGGSSLEDSGGRGRHARSALESLSDALLNDKPVPEECIVGINKRVIPKRMYIMMVHMGWKKRSGANQVRGRLKDQPYLAT